MRIETVNVRSLLFMVDIPALVASAPGTQAADQKCRPVKGHAVTTVVPPPACTSPVGFCTSGRIFGTLKGDLTLTTTQFIPTLDDTIPSVMFFVGQSVVTTKRGETLTGTDAGAIDLADGTASTLITWTGGTGRFAGASGHIRVAPNLNQATNTVFSVYWGELCTPD
jgi:hypothetical protein